MQSSKFKIRLLLSLLTILACIQLNVFAHPNDKKMPIYLSADKADLNHSTHRGEYVGHVDFRQGTSHITAARAVTIADKNNKLTQAIAYGDSHSQAHFTTITKDQNPQLHAFAKIIRYFPAKHLIELEGKAVVTQGNDRFEADLIRYDTINQHVLSDSEVNHRTLIIINSDKVK